VLTLAERHGVLIAEDDVHGHLLPGHGTRLRSCPACQE
jgi:DNA-binding transcriptional MocR family regulator